MIAALSLLRFGKFDRSKPNRDFGGFAEGDCDRNTEAYTTSKCGTWWESWREASSWLQKPIALRSKAELTPTLEMAVSI
jgi:hypothetical protein